MKKKSTKYPCPVKSDFKVDEDQIRDLEDALGDERLYGGGIIDAAVKVNAKKKGRNVAIAEITIYVLCDGDFGEDEDGNFITEPRWLKFDIDNEYKFHYGLNPDTDDTEEEWYFAGTTTYSDDDIMKIFKWDVETSLPLILIPFNVSDSKEQGSLKESLSGIETWLNDNGYDFVTRGDGKTYVFLGNRGYEFQIVFYPEGRYIQSYCITPEDEIIDENLWISEDELKRYLKSLAIS